MLSCTELGLGHVSRLMLLGKRLEDDGSQLFFFAGGNAYKLLKREFKNVYHCKPVAWYENARGIILSASLLNILFPLPYISQDEGKLGIKLPSGIETMHRYYDLRKNILKIKPDLIVSDGDLHALRLAHRWKFPSVYVTNVIRPCYGLYPLLLPGERFTECYVKSCSKIIIPDNPPPYTICEYNLGNLKEVGVEDKVEFVGSFIDMTPIKGMEDHIFASISGPYGTRAKLKQIVLPVLSKLKTKSIVSLGEHGERKVEKTGNCTIYSWLSPQERQRFMTEAKLVVFSGGHTTCFETIKHEKPSICIPTQPEQLANAEKMRYLNCSMVARNGKQLLKAIQEMEGRIDFYKNNVQRLNQYSNKFKGLEKTVEIIEEVARSK